jgi:cation/acetate symporter
MGPEKLLIEHKNFGIISVPPGFLAVSIGSPLLRDRCAEGMWNDVHARQNTGLLASKAATH